MALPELSLAPPGRFWATAENEESTTFHLVVPKDQYTRERLTEKPAISPGDDLMEPWTVSHQNVDKDGRAVLDLGESGRAKQIIDKLNGWFKQGRPAPKVVRAIVIVTALKGNRVPSKQLADVIDFRLGAVPRLSVQGVRAYVAVRNFKQGVRDFIVDFRADGLEKVKLSTSNGSAVRVDGGPTGNGIELAVGAARKFRVRIPVSLKNESKTRKIHIGAQIIGGRAWNGTRIWYWRQQAGWRVDRREVWRGESVTLTVEGKGAAGEMKQSIKMRAESWASNWLVGKSPPKVYVHGHC